MHIREAKLPEAELLSELAFESKAYWGYSEQFMNACTDELSVSAQDIRSEKLTYRACENDSEVIGFYAIERISDNEAELEALFVKPAFIGKGVGKMLLRHAISYTKSKGYKLLKIQSDPNAEEFYLASGAVRVGEEKSLSIEGRYLPILHHDLKCSFNTECEPAHN